MAKHKTIWNFIFMIFTVFLMTSVASAQEDDIDDIEADMDTALSESDAAQNLAEDKKHLDAEEKKKMEETKKQALTAQANALQKEAQAKKEIAKLEERIAATRIERKKYDKQKTEALARIEVLNNQVKAKNDAFTKVAAERDVAKEERDRQLAEVKTKEAEKKKIEEDIKKDRAETAQILKEIEQLKIQIAKANANLLKIRANAAKEAEKKTQAQTAHTEAKRKLASIPTKVLVRTAKYDCDATDRAADGALVIGKIAKGSKQELYRIVNKRWVEAQLGEARVFIPKTCF